MFHPTTRGFTQSDILIHEGHSNLNASVPGAHDMYIRVNKGQSTEQTRLIDSVF